MNQIESLSQLYHAANRIDRPGVGFDAMNAAARELRLAANVLHRLAEQECNGIERWDDKARMRLASWTDEDQQRADRTREKQRKRVLAAVAGVFGDAFTVQFQNDPRGAMFYIEQNGARLYSW